MLKIKQSTDADYMQRIVGYYWSLQSRKAAKYNLEKSAQTKLYGAALVTNWLALNVHQQ